MNPVADSPQIDTQALIGQLLHKRQQALVAFCRVAGLEPYTENKPVADLLQEFCQILMDYTALGHFEVYPRLGDGAEEGTEAYDQGSSLCIRIANATQVAVEFNDRYEPGSTPLPLADLPKDLSNLGEVLAQRIELEDRLLATLEHCNPNQDGSAAWRRVMKATGDPFRKGE